MFHLLQQFMEGILQDLDSTCLSFPLKTLLLPTVGLGATILVPMGQKVLSTVYVSGRSMKMDSAVL